MQLGKASKVIINIGRISFPSCLPLNTRPGMLSEPRRGVGTAAFRTAPAKPRGETLGVPPRDAPPGTRGPRDHPRAGARSATRAVAAPATRKVEM